ncbi:MAG: amidohydrolase, partial [Bradyrhizobium sp.]
MTDQTTMLPGDELAFIRNKGAAPIVPKATTRDRGVGPFKRLALRSATVIDGTGAPP